MTETLRIKAGEGEADLQARVADVCQRMEKIYELDCYSKITVVRHWSQHNPTISGEVARPSAYRWYLQRELLKLLLQGAEIEVQPSRPGESISIHPRCWQRSTKAIWISHARNSFYSAPSA